MCLRTGKGTTQQSVYLTLGCDYAHAVFTLPCTVIVKADKKDYKKQGWEEVRGGDGTS